MIRDMKTLTFPTAETPPAELPPLSLLLPEQLQVLSIENLGRYADRVARRYQSYRAAFEDEGIDTTQEMLELGPHLAMVTVLLSERSR